MSNQSSLVNVANYDQQWTGIAVIDRRIFVNFPRWSNNVPVSVAELELPDKVPVSLNELLPPHNVHPFPNSEWNEWNGGARVRDRFVCVQSVVADRTGYLWVLDSGNPRFTGVIPGAPKLLKFAPRDGRLLSRIPYAEPVILPHSYLNDVRIDTERGMAYLTDSAAGAIIVTDLRSGSSRRLLDDHRSVKAEEIDVDIGIGKTRWWRKDDEKKRVHSDGIALHPKNETLYFHALTGRTLYKVPTAALRDHELPLKELRESVHEVKFENTVDEVEKTGCADGMEFTSDGTLYITSLEDNAVKRLCNGQLEIAVMHSDLEWPDSLAVGSGVIYVTTSRIHLGRGPYSLFRFEHKRPDEGGPI
jgi:sugar lactone lactonase YvrE